MQRNIKIIAIVTSMLIGTSGMAFAQGSTDAKGNAMGSQNVSSTGAPRKSGKMHSMKHSKKSMHKGTMKKSSE
ncbi:MAG: hypothetical protein JO141_21230 [Bradyrhizobium sp.]|nr:hypothetical protein [Bradyrhizobium sp.]